MSSSSDIGGAGVAGKLILPDMSQMVSGQAENVAAMSVASKEASSVLQDIIRSQQSALQETLTAFQQVLEMPSAGAAQNEPLGAIQVMTTNMEKLMDQFSATADKTAMGAEESMAKLTLSAQQSFQKVEETATKFSGG